MKEESFIKQIWWKIQDLKSLFCEHEIITLFTAETILREKWERVTSFGVCNKCGRDFSIAIPANQAEAENYWKESTKHS